MAGKDSVKMEDFASVLKELAVVPPSTFENSTTASKYADVKSLVNTCLPPNYNFEIEKTLEKLEIESVKHVALQFPEGLLMFSTQISQILKLYLPKLQVTIMGDVAYGACCIDDYTARAIGCDFIVHYGHSCLVSIDFTFVPCMYVFVDIFFDPSHLFETLKLNFNRSDTLALMSTIQYVKPLHSCLALLKEANYFDHLPYIPQSSPLTSGEVLGCTSPILPTSVNSGTKPSPITASQGVKEDDLREREASSVDLVQGSPVSSRLTPREASSCCKTAEGGTASSDVHKTAASSQLAIDFVVFVADGRFHLESAMIQNPNIPFYRYDPFTKVFFREYYDHARLHQNRKRSIEMAKRAASVGIIMGTLGRQGNVKLVDSIRGLVSSSGKMCFIMLLCEIMPHTIGALSGVEAFVQIACPRLSIDWGHHFAKPLLSPYEAFVAFGSHTYQDVYPMDFYAKRGGAWTNYHSGNQLAPSTSPTSSDDRKAAVRLRLAQKRELKQRLMQRRLAYEAEAVV